MNRNPKSKKTKHKIKRPSQRMFNRVLDQVAQRLASDYLKRPTACTTIRCYPIPGLSPEQQLEIDAEITSRAVAIINRQGYHPLVVVDNMAAQN